MPGAGGRPRAPRWNNLHLLALPPAKPDPDDGTTPPRWVTHLVLAADGSEVLPAFARQLLGGSGLRDEPGQSLHAGTRQAAAASGGREV